MPRLTPRERLAGLLREAGFVLSPSDLCMNQLVYRTRHFDCCIWDADIKWKEELRSERGERVHIFSYTPMKQLVRAGKVQLIKDRTSGWTWVEIA